MSATKDPSSWNLDYSDIMDIFKNNLKIENSLKSIQSIFMNKRYAEKINYKPYFQRNYVWDAEKASYFIESILLGTEIPPLVLFKGASKENVKNEVIDGRQRYETLLKFLENELILQEKGLHRLHTFSGNRFVDFEGETLDSFNNTRLRILQCSVSNEPTLTSEKEDKIKKEIFKRYNSGITPLTREENTRAEYIDDSITKAFKEYLEKAHVTLDTLEELFLSKSKQGIQERDKINILLDRIRTLLALTEIPIYDYAKSSQRSDIVKSFYIVEISQRDPSSVITQFVSVVEMLMKFKINLCINQSYNNALFYESLCWSIFKVVGQDIVITEDDITQISNDILQADDNPVFWKNILNPSHKTEALFELTGSHYRNATIDRYRFISNYFSKKFDIDFTSYMKDADKFAQVKEKYKSIKIEQYKSLKLIKPDPVSVTIDDILMDMSNSKFLVRPTYQRSEVNNIKKSSYLLESIMLGIKIPPIYIYKREDKVKEVIDGQQRLLTLLGFLGKTYISEDGSENTSEKHKFKLSGLKILQELNGKTVDFVEEKYQQYYDNIMDFSIDVVEIDATQNPNFNSIDLFMRLNTKPFPIRPNTFEMWNAYVAKAITQKIKDIASNHEGKTFKVNNPRMSNEGLIMALAYLHYQKTQKKVKYSNLLTIYLRGNRVSARISSKDRITKMLEELDHKDIGNFEKSIDEVNNFVAKICMIAGSDGKQLFDLLGAGSKSDQNFYFLWIILENISTEDIVKHKETMFVKIQQLFVKIVNFEDNLEIEQFIDSISCELKNI